MNDSEKIQPATIGVGDILYTLFRHKWKIFLFLLLGLAGAGVLWRFNQPLYTSDAAMIVKYVADVKGPEVNNKPGTEIVRSPDQRGNNIVESEMVILGSEDVILRAVDRVGPNKILARHGGGTNRNDAARLIAKNLKVSSTVKDGQIIFASLGHKDAEIAQTTLDRIVKEYLDKHFQVHRSSDTFDFLQEQTLTIRQNLDRLEEQLRLEKRKVNVISLEDSKNYFVTELAALSKAIREADATLAEGEANLAQIAKVMPGWMGASQASTNAPAATNETGAAASVPAPQLKPTEVARFRDLFAKVNALKDQEKSLLKQFTETSRPVKKLREELILTEQSLKDLGITEEMIAQASLGGQQVGSTGVPVPMLGGKVFDPTYETARIVALKAKIKMLREQHATLKLESEKVDSQEGAIMAMQRQKDLAEEMYNYFFKNLEQAKIDAKIQEGQLNNITPVQAPTVARQEFKPLYKKMGMAVIGAMAIGILLAFALDMALDPTFKRAKEVESALRMPVWASIPDFGKNGHSKLKKQLANGDGGGAAAQLPASLKGAEIAPWDEQDPMLAYYEAIRDRLVMSYGGDMHKPKIIGLTSCNPGAGVSRIATGLAASLSRDVERNVLLIGLEKNKVAVMSFEKGRPAEFEPTANGNGNGEKNDGAQQVEKNLYSLVTTGRNLAGASTVQSFSDLLPKLKGSYYDYIVFDLPELTQTSGALRLAAQMERTLLVIEAEETSKEKLKRAKSLLGGAASKTYAVLNRAQSYGPVRQADEI